MAVTSVEAIQPCALKAFTLPGSSLGILTFGDLRIFWQSLEPGITFSEIGLAWLQDLSFRPRHNYSCSGSILATVTVLLGADTEGYSVPADEEGRCPSSEP